MLMSSEEKALIKRNREAEEKAKKEESQAEAILDAFNGVLKAEVPAPEEYSPYRIYTYSMFERPKESAAVRLRRVLRKIIRQEIAELSK